jgi:hypothetical protein
MPGILPDLLFALHFHACVVSARAHLRVKAVVSVQVALIAGSCLPPKRDTPVADSPRAGTI